MNVCILSGRVWKNATVKGTEPRTLTFVLETRHGAFESDKKERAAFVPCVLFNPTPELEALLAQQGEGLTIEFEGRLCSPNPDTNGGRRFNTEVIVRNRTLTVLSPVAETVQ